MSVFKSARFGRNLIWMRRGIDECGGGFLGLFLFSLFERSEERQKKKEQERAQRKSPLDGLLDAIEE